MARPLLLHVAELARCRKAPPPKSPHTPEAGRAYDEHGNVRPADGRWHTGDPEAAHEAPADRAVEDGGE